MYNTANNSFGKLEASIWPSATSFIMQTAYSELFPLHNGTTDADYFVKLEQRDELNNVIKREIVLVTGRTDELFSITRGAWYCPASDTATTQTNTSFWFNAGDSVSLTVVSEQIQQMESDIAEKAQDDTVVKLTGNQTVGWIKTFSSSPIVPTPTTDYQATTKKYVDDTLLEYSIPSLKYDIFTAWETLSKWNLIRYWIEYPNQTISQTLYDSNDSRWYIWYDNTNTKAWQSFTTTWWNFVSIECRLWKTWSPSWNLTAVIRTAAWWWTIVWTSSNTISETSLSVWYWWLHTFNFSGVFLPSWVYYIELYTSRANNTSNYSFWVLQQSNVYAWWTLYTINSWWTWTSIAIDHTFTINVTWTWEVSTKVYKAKSNIIEYTNIIWSSLDDYVLDDDCVLCLVWKQDWYTWLTPWSLYYLQDNWSIWLTPWTISVKVWKAISSTNINFIPQL